MQSALFEIIYLNKKWNPLQSERNHINTFQCYTTEIEDKRSLVTVSFFFYKNTKYSYCSFNKITIAVET